MDFFAHLSRDFQQIFGQIVSIRIKTLGNTNTVAQRLTKIEKGSLPVDACRSKTSLLKLPNETTKVTKRGLPFAVLDIRPNQYIAPLYDQ